MMRTEKQQKEVFEMLDKAGQNDIDIKDSEYQEKFVKMLNILDINHSYLGQVEEFMNNFKQDIQETYSTPNKDVMKLRLNLLLEELCELAEACGQEVCSNFSTKLHDKSEVLHKSVETQKVIPVYSPVMVMDALCDIQYVLSGAILSFGLQNKFNECFEEVHRSNMSKSCNSLAEAQETKSQYETTGTPCYIDATEELNGIWLVKKKEDQKLLKAIHYSKADILNILFPKPD